MKSTIPDCKNWGGGMGDKKKKKSFETALISECIFFNLLGFKLF